MHYTIVSSFVKATYFWGVEMRFLETKTIIMGLLKKSLDKNKYEYHIVTGTEAGFMCYTICCPFITLIICFVIIFFLPKVIIIGRIAKKTYALICIYTIL